MTEEQFIKSMEDFVSERKECSQEELKSFTKNMLREYKRKAKRLNVVTKHNDRKQKELDDTNQTLTDKLKLRVKEIDELNQEIIKTQKEIIFTMGEVVESRSQETGNHVKRVAQYSYLLAKKIGLSESEASLLRDASPMHDIGKIGIPDSILNKPAKLTPDEFELMKTHTRIGYDLLRHSKRPLLKVASIVAHEHHEKWIGNGYPRGLKGEEIHIYGRITAIADVFDALGSERVYKKAWDLERILNLFEDERGKHFDPNLIDLFFENLDSFLEIRREFDDY
jgi:response regulator RpfG family c-di-GMP phosphodiesterase